MLKKILKSLLPKRVRQPVANFYHLLVAVAANIRYGFPARSSKVIMLTGTNGKTSTAVLIASILEHAGHKVGLNTTAFYRIGDDKPVNKKSGRTIEDMFELHALLRRMKRAKCDYIILEATSQALDQHRLCGIPTWAAIMTNLTQDHLDYHGSMNRYAAAKFRLFARRPPIIILNRDDEWFEYFNRSNAAKIKLSYGENKDSGARISDVNLRKDGSDFTLTIGKEKLKIQTELAGKFNVINAAAAATFAFAEAIEPKRILAGIAAMRTVPGRMERVDAGQPFDVYVDYAHTPDALKNVLSTVQEITKGKVFVVFGATGNRDKSKRPIMGKIAAKHADHIFLTDDETYHEDGAAIRAAVLSGIKDAGGAHKTTEIGDRREAFAAAFAMAKRGDAVVLAGMGHETSRNIGGKPTPWNDTEEAKKLLRKLR